MKPWKVLFAILLEASLILWAVHFYIALEKPQLIEIILVFSIALGPLILAYVGYLFKKALFRIIFTIISLFLIISFCISYFLPFNPKKEFGAQTYVTMDYFKKKAGFFSSYSSIVVSYDYPDSISRLGQHIVKNFYRIGNKSTENYYIGKLLLDKDYNIIKEFYNKRAIDDTLFFENEFGKVFSQMIFIRNTNVSQNAE